jgi:hypothetical protein
MQRRVGGTDQADVIVGRGAARPRLQRGAAVQLPAAGADGPAAHRADGALDAGPALPALPH